MNIKFYAETHVYILYMYIHIHIICNMLLYHNSQILICEITKILYLDYFHYNRLSYVFSQVLYNSREIC